MQKNDTSHSNSSTASNNGFVAIPRQFIDWEWYTDLPTFKLFFHLLLKANWTSKDWHGITIRRGQLLSGRKKLSQETGLSEQQIRTALTKLSHSNHITQHATNRYTVYTIVNYNYFHPEGMHSNQQITNKQPTDNQQATTTNNYKNNNNIKEELDFESLGWSEKVNCSLWEKLGFDSEEDMNNHNRKEQFKQLKGHQ